MVALWVLLSVLGAMVALILSQVNWRWVCTFLTSVALLWVFVCIIIPFAALFLLIILDRVYP